MAVTLSSLAGAGAQFFDNNGVPLAGGLIYTYLAGTTTPATTYTSSLGLIAHTNPIVLDAAGRIATGEVWLTSGVDYKFLVKTSADVQLGSYDNIPSINDFTTVVTLVALANTTNPVLGDALVGFRQSNSAGNLIGSVGRTVHQKLQEIVSVKDFGAIGDEITDDTAAIQSAFTWLTSYTSTESAFNRGGRALYFPAGNYLVSSTLTIASKDSVSIFGDGAASCIFGAFDLDAPLITVGDNSRLMAGFRCENLAFAGSTNGNLTNTVCMVTYRQYNAIIDNCTFDRAFTSLHLFGFGHSFVRGCEMRRLGNVNVGSTKRGYGIILDDDGVTGGCYGVHIDDCEFHGGGDIKANFIKANLYIRDIDGLYVTNTHMYNAENIILIDPDGVDRNTVTTLQFDNSYFDTAIGPHLKVVGKVKSTGTGNITFGEFMFSNCYFRNSENNHVRIEIANDSDVPLKNVLFDGCLFKDCSTQSFINNSQDGKVDSYKIESCIFDICDRTGGNEIVQDLHAKNISVQNCRFSDTLGLTAGTTTCAVLVTPIAESNVQISNNDYLIETSFDEPVALGPFPTTMRSFNLNDYGSSFGGIAQIDRTYDKSIGSLASELLAVIAVAENFVGVVEYTLMGNDGANAAAGFHAESGYFAFSRAIGGATTVYNHTVSFLVRGGTLASNTTTVGQFAPNCWIEIDNLYAGTVKYSANLKIMMRYVET